MPMTILRITRNHYTLTSAVAKLGKEEYIGGLGGKCVKEVSHLQANEDMQWKTKDKAIAYTQVMMGEGDSQQRIDKDI